MEKVVLVSAAVAALLATPAMAADLPVKAPVYRAPAIAPVYNWTGFYVGLNLGGSWGHQDGDLINTTTGTVLGTGSTNLDGIIGGGQIGYNWQINQWVFGLEADFQGSGQKSDGSFFLAAPPATVAPTFPTSIAYTDKLDWFGTVRGRIGYA